MFLASPVRPIKHLSFHFISIPGDKLKPHYFIFAVISLPILLPLLSLLLHHFQISSTFVTLLYTFIYKFAHLALVHVTRTLIAVWKWNKACQIAQETGVCHFLVSGYLKCKGKNFWGSRLCQDGMNFQCFGNFHCQGLNKIARGAILSYIYKYNWFLGAQCTHADWTNRYPVGWVRLRHTSFFYHRRMKCI